MIPRAACRRIVEAIAKERGLAVAEITGPLRRAELVRARVTIARRLSALGVSINQIGPFVGRNHATVVYYLKHRPINYARKAAQARVRPTHGSERLAFQTAGSE